MGIIVAPHVRRADAAPPNNPLYLNGSALMPGVTGNNLILRVGEAATPTWETTAFYANIVAQSAKCFPQVDV